MKKLKKYEILLTIQNKRYIIKSSSGNDSPQKGVKL